MNCWICLTLTIQIELAIESMSNVHFFVLFILIFHFCRGNGFWLCSFCIRISLGSSTGSCRKVRVYRRNLYKLFIWVLVKRKRRVDIGLICTCVRIQTFLKWRIYTLGRWANDRNLVPGHVCNIKKDIRAIKHENMIKIDYNV